MTATAHRVAELCAELDERARTYAEIEQERAEAEAAYRTAKAKAIVRAKAAGHPATLAESVAMTDDDLGVLLIAHLSADGRTKAAREYIMALRTRIDFGRSRIATERVGDALHANGYGGRSA